MKIARAREQIAQQRAVVLQVSGNDVQYLALALYLTDNAEEVGAKHRASVFFREIPPHHDIEVTGFVLQREEKNAAGSAGSLAGNDQAGGAHMLAVRQVPELSSGKHAQTCKPVAQKRERMTPEREADVPVISNDILALSGPSQQRQAFGDDGIRQNR